MGHTVYALVHMSVLVSVHYKESLVWFKVSVFCYTIDTGLTLELFLDILLLSCAMEILRLWVCRPDPFACSSRS